MTWAGQVHDSCPSSLRPISPRHHRFAHRLLAASRWPAPSSSAAEVRRPSHAQTRITSDNCYPYWLIHRNFVLELLGLRTSVVSSRAGEQLRNPSCPCLFFWGGSKGLRPGCNF